jgi:hypothetical protein
MLKMIWDSFTVFAESALTKVPYKHHTETTRDQKYNVLVELETTYEPLDLTTKDDPVTSAEYAGQNALLNMPGCTRFKHLAKYQKKLERMVNQAKLSFFR